MPLFDIECDACGKIFEYLQITSQDVPICPKCQSCSVHKIFSSAFHIRTDPDTMKHNLPDPSPPLEELRSKGTEGYKDKPYASTQLKDYTRRKDKLGNTIWTEKKRQYFDMGKRT